MYARARAQKGTKKAIKNKACATDLQSSARRETTYASSSPLYTLTQNLRAPSELTEKLIFRAVLRSRARAYSESRALLVYPVIRSSKPNSISSGRTTAAAAELASALRSKKLALSLSLSLLPPLPEREITRFALAHKRLSVAVLIYNAKLIETRRV